MARIYTSPHCTNEGRGFVLLVPTFYTTVFDPSSLECESYMNIKKLFCRNFLDQQIHASKWNIKRTCWQHANHTGSVVYCTK